METGVRHGSHWGPQDDLRNVWTYGMILALAYMLHHLSAVWLQFQIRERSPSWK